eukprot:1339866-Amorphochlora_amoeboformis.AAC.1
MNLERGGGECAKCEKKVRETGDRERGKGSERGRGGECKEMARIDMREKRERGGRGERGEKTEREVGEKREGAERGS